MDSFSWLEILFIFFTLALLFYYCFFWRKLLIFRVKNTSFSNLPLVSVIICAKNEANNLSKFLSYVLNQDYPNFEVIVVNDSSSDDSLKILNQASIHYENLRVYTFEKEKISFGKKEALEFGIVSPNLII
jgi:cellulose synthase/poly-beta-1,6-N-acetylglucosamine synthase-like glycosyltransferase